MSEQSGQTRACPTCGNTVPAMARYCPSCGTRLNPEAAYTSDDFESALADVLDAPVDEPVGEPDVSVSQPVSPADAQPPITVTPDSNAGWTARASDWTEPTGQPGSWATPSPPIAASPLRRGGR